MYLLFSMAASNNLILEIGDVCNAYFHGKVDVPIYMEQQTNPSRHLARPGQYVNWRRIPMVPNN